MIIQGQIPLNLLCFLEILPELRLQGAPDGWLITGTADSSKPAKFVLITNDLNVYSVTHCISHVEKTAKHQWTFQFYETE